MALLNKTLTDKEKAVLYWHVFGGVNDWHLLYKTAINEATFKGKTLNNLRDYVSKWKNSEKVKNYIRELEILKLRMLETAKEEGKIEGAESVRTKSGDLVEGAVFVDYSNPTNQIRKLNTLINKAKDPNEALDALKVLIASQKADKETLKEGKPIRAYLPISCHNCPLYLQESAKVEEEGNNMGIL